MTKKQLSEDQDLSQEQELYNELLEQQILGCILIENRVLNSVELELTEDSFYYEINKVIFKTIKNLLQDNRQADENTLYYSLSENSQNLGVSAEELRKYISTIISYGAGSSSTPKEITKILNFLTLKRKLSFYQKEINNVINNSSITEIDEKIGNLEQQIYSLTNERRSQDNYSQIKKYTKILEEKLKKARKSDKTILGVRTDLTDLDNYTGGLQKSDLIIIAARPSMGKTALAVTIARNIANILRKESSKQKSDENEKPQSIAMFSLEMSGEQLAARIVAMDSKFSTKTIHTGRYDIHNEEGEIIEANKKISDTEWNKIYQSMQDIAELPLYIDDTPALSISILRSRARYMKNKYNICAIIIDYLQLIKPSKNFGANRVLEIAEITGTLKAIAKELDIPVVALSQLSRAVEMRERDDKRPQLSDLRESGTIEQDADIVMFLYRDEYYEARKEPKITDENDEKQVNNYISWKEKYDKIKNLAEIIVAKNRNGPVGTIMLSFNKEHMLFNNYTPLNNPYDKTIEESARNSYRKITNQKEKIAQIDNTDVNNNNDFETDDFFNEDEEENL